MMISVILMSMLVVPSYIYAAPLDSICQIPNDLHDHYKMLSKTMKGLAFLDINTDSSLSPDDDNKTPEDCPKEPQTKGHIKDRSTCPWIEIKNKRDDLFPSEWMSTKCRCSNCIGRNGAYSCQSVFTPTLLLKRTVCKNGTYVYERIIKEIRTGCVCAYTASVYQPVSN